MKAPNPTPESIFDFVERVNPSVVGKKTIESLIYAGAFDYFEPVKREQYLAPGTRDEPFVEILYKYGQRFHNDTIALGNSLFGTHESIKPVRPEIPVAMEVDKMELLKRERELVGMFLSAHPLDQYRFEIKTFTSNTIGEAAELASQALQDSSLRGKEMIIAGMVTNSKSSVTKTGRPFVSFSVEDFNGTIQFSLFGKDYENFMKYTHPGTPLLIKVAILQKYGFQNNGDDSAKQVDCELKVRSMRLLSNTREDFIKSITLSLPVSMITKNLRRDLTNIFKENKGSTRVVVKILDYETQISVEFVSIKYSVALTDVLLNYLEANGIEWSITPTLSF